MSLVFDLIIIASAAFAIYRGVKRGFVKSVMHFASLIIAVVCVFAFTEPLANWLDDQFVGSQVSQTVETSITTIVDSGSEKSGLETVFTDPPQSFSALAERFSCTIDDLHEYYTETLSTLSPSEAISKLSDKIAESTANAISTVIAAIVIFVAAMLACALITLILDTLCRLPVLKQLNKILGIVFGVASALLSACIVASISVGLINAFSAIRSDIFNDSVITNSVILKFFYNNDLIFFK